jgi:TRAP transporter TAXI family solute receptor
MVSPRRRYRRDHRPEGPEHRGDLGSNHGCNRQLEVADCGQSRDAFLLRLPGGLGQPGQGTRPPRKHNVRLVMGFYEQPLHIVTKDGTGIKSLMDFKGKRVSTGAPNSGTEEQADYVLKALGIDWNKDFSREKLGATESVAALKDGKIQAFFWSGAVPTSSITDLASTPGLKMVLLPVGGEIAGKITKANPEVFHKTVFAKGCYAGVDSDIDAIAITAVLTAMDTFPQDRLYQIVGAIFSSQMELSAVWKDATKLTPARAVNQETPDSLRYLHPGAQKFFKEKGVLK